MSFMQRIAAACHLSPLPPASGDHTTFQMQHRIVHTPAVRSLFRSASPSSSGCRLVAFRPQWFSHSRLFAPGSGVGTSYSTSSTWPSDRRLTEILCPTQLCCSNRPALSHFNGWRDSCTARTNAPGNRFDHTLSNDAVRSSGCHRLQESISGAGTFWNFFPTAFPSWAPPPPLPFAYIFPTCFRKTMARFRLLILSQPTVVSGEFAQGMPFGGTGERTTFPSRLSSFPCIYFKMWLFCSHQKCF